MRAPRISLAVLGTFLISVGVAEAQVVCNAVRGPDGYAGVCLESGDTVFQLQLTAPATDRLWRGTAVDQQGFAGSIGVDDSVFRYGRYWAEVTNFRTTADTLSFSFSSVGSVTPTEADLAILEAARKYLAEPGHWSRDPDPDVAAAVKRFLDDPGLSRGGFCPTGRTRTLFCALYHASINVAGEFWWGRPAVNAIRAAVIAESAGRLRHPLMQFNGAAETSLEDVLRVFDFAIGYVKERRMCNVQYWVWSEVHSKHCK